MLISTLQVRRRASRRILSDLPVDLDAMELDDPIVLVGRVREVLERQQRRERGRSPADRKAYFGIPSAPTISRLHSPSGITTFHFAVNNKPDRTASGFDAYINRAKELGAEAVAKLDVGLLEGTAASFDAYMLDHGHGDRPEDRGLVTSLDRDDAKRGRQWDAIEAHERGKRQHVEPGPPRINIRFDLAPDFLYEAATRFDCPSGLRQVIFAERDRVSEGRPLPKHKQATGVPWIDEDALSAMTWLRSLPGWNAFDDEPKPPVTLSLGRGVDIVVAGEVALPSCLDQNARRNVALGLNNYVQSLAVADRQARQASRREHDGDVAPKEILPAVFREHQPDRLNHPDNVHLHFQIGTRPCVIKNDGSLSFSQHKVDVLTKKKRISLLRDEAARLINVELGAINADICISPRSNAALGIDAGRQVKLGSKRTVLERASVPTDAGLHNTIEGWRRAFEANERHHDELALALRRTDESVRDRIARIADDDKRKRLEQQQAAAYQEALRASNLRREAVEIALWVDMARSRAELTQTYAPEYARAALRADGRDTYSAHRWRARGGEAGEYLRCLDVELAVERGAIADRERELIALESRSQQRAAAIERDIAASLPPRNEANIIMGRMVEGGTDRVASASVLSPAGAASIIATKPLALSVVDGAFTVRAEDDPDGFLHGVDLTTQVKRLRGIHAMQTRELDQLVAYVRRHGNAALEPERMAGQTKWLRDAASKWHGTPALDRAISASRRAARRAQLAALMASAEDSEWRETLPNQVDGIERPNLTTLEAIGIVFTTVAAASAQSSPNNSTTFEPITPTKLDGDQGEARSGASVKARSSNPAHISKGPREATFDKDEQALIRSARFQISHDRALIDREVVRALRSRAGDEGGVTPFAAHLLNRIANGFDPAKVDRRPAINGRTKDQRDADEITLHSRDPLFRNRSARARARESSLLAEVDKVVARSSLRDQRGLVAIRHGRVDFGPSDRGENMPMRTPREFAEDFVANVEPLTFRLDRRPDGSVGFDNPRLLQASRYNYLGLLNPKVQEHLEMCWRIQREVRRGILARIGNGSITPAFEMISDPVKRAHRCKVVLKLADPVEQQAADMLAHDPLWYEACKTASIGERDAPSTLRHPDPVARAYLIAYDESAQAGVQILLGDRVKHVKPDPRSSASDTDRSLQAALVSPTTSVSPPRQQQRRRKRARGIPLQPGRDLHGR